LSDRCGSGVAGSGVAGSGEAGSGEAGSGEGRLAPASELVHLGRPAAEPGAPVNPPVVLSSTYHQGGAVAYGRDGNPTWDAVEEVIGALEGGRAHLFASGLAAISSLLETLPVPAWVVVAGDSYNGTRRFLLDVAGRGRLRLRTVDAVDTAATLEVCAQIAAGPDRSGRPGGGFGGVGILWLESPSNPLLAIADLPALVDGARKLGFDVVVDNTFCTPLLQRPLEFGADAVVHSCTKLMSGHSDVVAGAVVSARSDVSDAVAVRRSLHGAIAGPWEAWLLLRGMRTLDVRLERAQASAGELASRLATHRAVERVRYPGLAQDPGHERARRQMSGFGTIVSFEVKGGAAAAEAVACSVRLATAGTSLGGVETLIERRGRWEGEHGVPPALLRMSVGIEHVEDLWADLDRALAAPGRS
jgi:cystathionine gamma-synthase